MCVPCTQECRNCTIGGGACTSCNAGYHLDPGNGTCVRCTDSRCTACPDLPAVCACKLYEEPGSPLWDLKGDFSLPACGWVAAAGAWVPCRVPGCIACPDDPARCSGCGPGLMLEDARGPCSKVGVQPRNRNAVGAGLGKGACPRPLNDQLTLLAHTPAVHGGGMPVLQLGRLEQAGAWPGLHGVQ